MKYLALVISVAALAACSTAPKKEATAPVSTAEVTRIDKTIAQLDSEISEIHSLEEKTYFKSIAGDPGLKKLLDKKINQYGPVETIEANRRVLQDLRQDLLKTGPKSIESAQNEK